MHYYIDGYNLLFRLVHNGAKLQQQRQDIIIDLNRKIELLGLDATIVFDATHQLGEGTRSHFKELEIVFTAEGELADEYIIDELKSSPTPSQETVVTSDKKLAWRARRRSAKTESVEEFVGWLNQRFKNKLRHLKEKQKPAPVKLPVALIVPPAPKKSEKPIPKASLEECQDYYQDVFEKEYNELKAKEKPRRLVSTESSKKKTKQNSPKKEEKDSSPISELDRWLKLFENPKNDNV